MTPAEIAAPTPTPEAEASEAAVNVQPPPMLEGTNLPLLPENINPLVEEPVGAAEGLRDVVSAQNETAAGLIETLDAAALTLGETRVSLWDAVVVMLVIIAIIIAAWLFSKLSHGLLARITRLDPSQRLLSEKLLSVGVWAIAILVGIDLLGIDLTAFAIFSGAFGLAIGFGLQKTFGNLIAGIILLMDKSIKPGDVIAVADIAGNETFGQIQKIGIRAVSITTRDEREYLIPNENLMVNQVENWSYSSKNVRMQIPVGISYGCDIDQAEKLMLEAAKSCRRVLEAPPPTVWLQKFGDSSVDFTIHCWIRDPEDGVGNVKSEVLKNLWHLFQRDGIEIPFPQRDLNLRNNEQFEQLIAAISQRIGRSEADTGDGAEKGDKKA
ncbi:mechanosensitive ion channel [Altererythrobacter sp. SALINAS58]|uniref:mechanosensitive ion channel family protein n=1 Tax=Alteripontixanthobacter muriae TaxID=2705546 RepID=UPI001577604C|nr:mechanosensitive ion channel domain-containing protein [Alteripontixanthobacter muriae]NTZ42166.1 mechanosensitive ion channel [Alteripontixanthobacter muriae]